MYSIKRPGLIQPFTWEGCVVKIADKIAYLGRDIEDARAYHILDMASYRVLREIVGSTLGFEKKGAHALRSGKAINTTVLINDLIVDLCEQSSIEKGLCFSLDNATDPWLYRDGNCKTVLASGADYVIFEGVMRVERVDEASLQLRLFPTLPKLDHWILHGNRLWGCRYGEDVNGKFVNCIYASKLGRPDLWYALDGLSSDSYFVNVGEPGAFTGVGVVGDCPVFFKENCIHKIYGSIPANFQMQNTTCRGVQRGSAGSLAISNEILYYKSRSDVCAYDGSLPVGISEQFGTEN